MQVYTYYIHILTVLQKLLLQLSIVPKIVLTEVECEPMESNLHMEGDQGVTGTVEISCTGDIVDLTDVPSPTCTSRMEGSSRYVTVYCMVSNL